jgi:redox-sensitive bicupin YhaK (pirin superfamily)
MNVIRRSDERGHTEHGWLDSRHSFSFGDYVDPRHSGFGPLRVINEDRVVPGAGFGTHGHRDMEIITYVISGELAHQDSLGNGSVLRPGDVQRMSAGTDIRHSEYNASHVAPVHFLQIWIEPDERGLAPSYEVVRFGADEARGRLRLIASPVGGEGSLHVHQDARLYGGVFQAGEVAVLRLGAGRLAYVHVVRGEIDVNDHRLSAGDAVELTAEPELRLAHGVDTEVFVFDLPGA